MVVDAGTKALTCPKKHRTSSVEDAYSKERRVTVASFQIQTVVKSREESFVRSVSVGLLMAPNVVVDVVVLREKRSAKNRIEFTSSVGSHIDPNESKAL